MKFKKLLKKLKSLFFLFAIISNSIFAQQKATQSENHKQPKLVVGIIVDQMRYDYIFRYWNKFSNYGFKRLVNDGFLCKNANYNYVPTFTGPGHASVYTGTTPSVHGIISNIWFDRNSDTTVYCSFDNSVKGVGTDKPEGKMSPNLLLTTTITDQLRLFSNFKSKVIGIALKDRGAILPVGHSANGAYWYEGATGNWITSSYYMNELPQWVKDFNERKLPEQYLSKPWNTFFPINQYTESTSDDNVYEGTYSGETKPVFPHDLPKLRGTTYDLIRSTPYGNTLTKDFAIASVKGEQLGKDSVTDMLCVSFSSTDYVGHQFGTHAIETEDTYIRLDRDLADLLKFLDENVGKKSYLLFLTADHAALENPQFLLDNKIPAGWFDKKPILDSLNKTFATFYGEGKYILFFDNDQIYLNRTLIKEKKLNLKVIQNETADFVQQFPQVAAAVSASRITESEFNDPHLSLLQKGFNRKRSGDVLILPQPGLLDWERKTGTSHGSAYMYDTHVPLIWYGWNIAHGSSAEKVDITDIAPTVSSLLNIEFTNGCTGKPITFIVK